MERLSTQNIAHDANGCIALCYQLNQPQNDNVQSAESQTAIAVQSLLDSQAVQDNQEEEDIFQCGKCKKQFNSITQFVKHKQSQCIGLQIQQQQLIQHQQLATEGSPSVFSSSLNHNQPYSPLPNITTNAPILQAHPCLSRTLNQPSNATTLTLGGVSSLSHLSQNMVFTDDLISLANIDTSSLNTQAIQMVTGPVQSNNTPTGVTILSPITSLAASTSNFTSPSGGHTGQLLVQPGQHFTLTAITDKSIQQSQLQHISSSLSSTSVQSSPMTVLTQSVQLEEASQGLKSSPTKAGRKSAQNSFITVLNADSSVQLNTKKGKSARNTKSNSEVTEEESNAKPKLSCTYCNKQFTKNFDLQQHIRAHTGEKPFQCIVCGRAFAQKSNVKKHMATHKVWPCGTSNTLPKQPEPIIDDKELITLTSSPPPAPESSLLPVTSLGSEMKPLASPAQQFSILKTEEKEEATPKIKVVVDNSYICQYCPHKFKTYYQLKTHLVNHKSEQVYKCVMKTCGHTFQDLDTFLEHVKSHENEMTYRCHQCHKYFKTLYDLGVHQYSHIYMNQGVKSGLRHFQCTKCGNKYTTPEALEHHLSTTSHDYKCPHCTKQFTCERFLRRHLPIHGSEGQFECQQCRKKFKTEHYLKSHILIHTGETPFTCEICQAAFNRKDKLKRHMTIHDTVKKYRCPFRTLAGCLKEFNRPDKLKAHIITHSGIKPYKCSVCDKSFSRRPHLIEHERGHKLDYRFKCEKCGKGYFRPKLFNEHKCQPLKFGTDHQFRPRIKRKVGRPRKQMNKQVTHESLPAIKGKQYFSHRRSKVNSQEFLDKVHSQQSNMFSSLDGGDEHGKKYQEVNTLNVEVVKAIPLVTSTKKGQSVVNVDGALHLSGLEEKNSISASLGHVQQISLGSSGELVDHYVVHLTESIDGSGPTIQTAFIPAVSGGQIFTSGPGGIQPIAIIEARSYSMSDASSTQVLSGDGSNAIITCTTDTSITPMVHEGTNIIKGEMDDTGMIMLTGEVSGQAGGDLISIISSHDHRTRRGEDGKVKMKSGHDSSRLISPKDEQAMVVIGDHGMMVSAADMVSMGPGGDMMDTLFAPQSGVESYVSGQVVVSGDQTYIACNVDYSSPDGCQ